ARIARRLLKKSDFQNRTPKKREILRYMVSKCSEYAEFCGKNFYKGTFSAASIARPTTAKNWWL
ncbi:MAG: hypothetical protein J6K89_06560, partial [Oscillospiraceae bacterium]|nr:hypothetical protein [Oscillospiraceae bacterium]